MEKIDIRDLSIGDWVRNPTTGSNYKITATFLNPMGEMLTAQVGGEGNEIRCFSENIEPIPLTPEILEKNGYVGAEFSALMRLNNSPIVGICPIEIKYIHELQHILRLTKTDKQIVL